jgi:hypothetical protein
MLVRRVLNVLKVEQTNCVVRSVSRQGQLDANPTEIVQLVYFSDQ